MVVQYITLTFSSVFSCFVSSLYFTNVISLTERHLKVYHSTTSTPRPPGLLGEGGGVLAVWRGAWGWGVWICSIGAQLLRAVGERGCGGGDLRSDGQFLPEQVELSFHLYHPVLHVLRGLTIILLQSVLPISRTFPNYKIRYAYLHYVDRKSIIK